MSQWGMAMDDERTSIDGLWRNLAFGYQLIFKTMRTAFFMRAYNCRRSQNSDRIKSPAVPGLETQECDGVLRDSAM